MTQQEYNKKGNKTTVIYYLDNLYLKEEKIPDFKPLLPGDTMDMKGKRYSIESIKFAKVGRYDYNLVEVIK